MKNATRMLTAALAIAALALLAAAPAAAAPPPDRSPDGAAAPLELVHRLAAPLYQWAAALLDGPSGDAPLQSLAARGGPAMDPNGAPDSTTDDGGGADALGGPAIDPNG